MRKELEKRRVLREIGKPARRSLTDALRDSGEDARMHGYSYGTYTDLICRAALGKAPDNFGKSAMPRKRPL